MSCYTLLVVEKYFSSSTIYKMHLVATKFTLTSASLAQTSYPEIYSWFSEYSYK